MSMIVAFYVMRINKHKMTVDDVPVRYREAVVKSLEVQNG